MRTRTLAALSALVISGVFLVTGCTGSPSPTPTPTDSASAALCAAAPSAGEASDSVEVTGDVGEEPTEVSFTTPLTVSEAERTVLVAGDGTQISSGDYVTYALAVYDGGTGELADAAGFGDEALPPIQVTPDAGPAQFFGCATAGSRIVMVLPDSSGSSPVYVIDVLDVIPADEWCAISDSDTDMPTVTFDDAGAPTITIPDADPPSEVQLEVLTEGDGDVVAPGDSVTVNYTGVKWSDGSVFDSSWERGEPATFSTTGVVVGFQRALEGQTVGSTVLVVMPPACGYGEEGEAELAGETLVFVVEIISTEPAQ